MGLDFPEFVYAEKKRQWANPAFFRGIKKHTGRCCGDACLAKTRPADGSLPFIYMGHRRRAKSDKEAKNNGSKREDQS